MTAANVPTLMARPVRSIALVTIIIVTLFVLLQSLHLGPRELETTTRQSLHAITHLKPNSWQNRGARILKVTSVHGQDNELYEGAIRSHEEQNRLHGYEIKVLREEIMNKYLSTPAYLLSLIVGELAKPEEERLEWLMFLEPDVMILNPQISLEVFLPPPDFAGAHFLGTQDREGFNCGVYFLRVHEWSVRMLVDMLSIPGGHPEIAHAEDEGRKAFQMVLKSDRFRSQVMYQPRVWYNAYQLNSTTFEGVRGDLLVHYHDLGGDKWTAMADMIARPAKEKSKWSIPLGETTYEREISDYWNRIRKAHELLQMARPKGQDKVVYDAVRRLEYASTYEVDDEEKMRGALLGLQTALGRQGDGGSV